MKKRVIKLKITAYVDRDNMVTALARSGYKVWIEEQETWPTGTDYYVCFELI